MVITTAASAPLNSPQPSSSQDVHEDTGLRVAALDTIMTDGLSLIIAGTIHCTLKLLLFMAIKA
jgi:hypothetical protein